MGGDYVELLEACLTLAISRNCCACVRVSMWVTVSHAHSDSSKNFGLIILRRYVFTFSQLLLIVYQQQQQQQSKAFMNNTESMRAALNECVLTQSESFALKNFAQFKQVSVSV